MILALGDVVALKSTETALTSLCIHGRSRVVGGGFIAATEADSMQQGSDDIKRDLSAEVRDA